ncbi:PH domain-containing protein [Serinicoccus sp. LYQ131]|uniref:PH domain-containing protein n=1 Tax=Serinicoccus sp. LYQ131 TaxID=3378797 RepID=UPI003854DB52
MKRTDTERSSEWGSPRWLGWLGWILLVVAVVLLIVSVVVERGVTWGSVSRVLPGLTPVVLILLSRMGTRATPDVLETTGSVLRRHRIPWDQVSDLRPDKPSRWADVIQAHLVDGSTVILQGVPPADLPRLQELRDHATRS